VERYRPLNLGTAPLRGLDRRHARSRWNSIGAHISATQNFLEFR
jgi:hypothetical protein